MAAQCVPPVDVRAELMSFHRTQYKADRMRLAVIGSEPISEIQAWVEDLFSPIPNDHTAPPPDSTDTPADASPPCTAQGEEVEALSTVEVEQGRRRVRRWTESSAYGREWKRAYLILPVSERRQLSLYFPAPPTQPEFRRCGCIG